MPTNILFSPQLRKYTVAVLLWGTAFSAPFALDGLLFGEISADDAVTMAVQFFILLHLMLMTFMERSFPAILDLGLIFLETAGLVFHLDKALTHPNQNEKKPILAVTVLQLCALAITAIFRSASIWVSSEPIYKQRFEFFGGYSGQDAPKLTDFFLWKSMSQPLLRGEAAIIKAIRAAAILFLFYTIPTYVIYTAILHPIYGSQITVQSVVASTASYTPMPVNITMAFPFGPQIDKSAITVQGTMPTSFVTACPVNSFPTPSKSNYPSYIAFSAGCGPPSSSSSTNGTWSQFNSIDLSIDFNSTSANQSTVVYVYVGEGDLTKSLPFIEPIVVVPGSHILVSLTLALRTFVSNSPLYFVHFSTPKPTAMNEISMVQPDPSPPSSGINSTTLRIIRVRPTGPFSQTPPIKLLSESRDPSALDGLSSAGGFWTFVNGAFTILFGANIAYFFLGSRPLSAQGLLHIFQKKDLERKWHEDFPALRTEGGQPGSKEAGVVAFLRERMVDVGDSDVPDKEQLPLSRRDSRDHAEDEPLVELHSNSRRATF
ncbi:short-chain dehydrogenase/reductase family protein [Favolaschia claudopus]|uniref:Short-chain dehydrogenase/reductase family protein n=1 Tax=Favolaschia claudopus TaxID=2862362 RepID=A0AAW0E245_9AGAR